MKNFLTFFWIFVFSSIIGFSVSAQTNSEYVVVTLTSTGQNFGQVRFSDTNLSLPPAPEGTIWPQRIALILNYMHSNGYYFIKMTEDSVFVTLIFRKIT